MVNVRSALGHQQNYQLKTGQIGYGRHSNDIFVPSGLILKFGAVENRVINNIYVYTVLKH